MFSTRIRWALFGLALGFAILVFSRGQRPLAFALSGVAALLAYGHFRYGAVRLAFTALRQGKLRRAAALLGPDSDLHSAETKAYRAWIKGAVFESKGELTAAAREMETAIELGLRTRRDESIARATLLGLEVKRGRLETANELFQWLEESGEPKALVQRVRDDFADDLA